jgi:hypothetical protein
VTSISETIRLMNQIDAVVDQAVPDSFLKELTA